MLPLLLLSQAGVAGPKGGDIKWSLNVIPDTAEAGAFDRRTPTLSLFLHLSHSFSLCCCSLSLSLSLSPSLSPTCTVRPIASRLRLSHSSYGRLGEVQGAGMVRAPVLLATRILHASCARGSHPLRTLLPLCRLDARAVVARRGEACSAQPLRHGPLFPSFPS
jgi:hypothetical protein